ncbi:unnamed protein product [Rotaria sp. Silwood1]|nr:unnamed protein product [Rotaria sp. Silwood1]
MSINRQVLTLDEFTLQQLRNIPTATGELSRLLRDIGLAAKRINVEVNKAGLVDILGDYGTTNIQGEEVKKLDIYANNQLIGVLKHGISCAGIGSEEMDEIEIFDDEVSNQSKYVCLFDPLDGSSNIDVNVSIGTIFGIYKRVSEIGKPCTMEDFLQPGVKQVAAGYIVYGSSTMLVYATRRGVNGFTLDPQIGEFCLSHPNIQCPSSGKIYSVNHATGGPYTQRYIGSMVADVHRNLIKGGIFTYPGTIDKPKGKLRLFWYAYAITTFIIFMAIPQNAGKSFIAGGLTIAILFLLMAGKLDFDNDHLLSKKVAEIFKLKDNYWVLLLLTAILNGLVAGFAALSGSLFRKMLSSKRRR